MKKGFTLIELLVVIAIVGVLAAAIVIGINPRKRINQANDTKIRNDIGQIATALEAFYTSNGYYPTQLSDLITSGDIRIVPSPPSGGGSVYNYARSNGCTATPPTNCEAIVYYPLRDPATSGNVWCWQSRTGIAVEIATCPAP